ncbi:CBS domain-containing protein [Chelatococcus asaccharovorans]|uniref:CBS domain protein n=1 Tax=Chelatococcus asaccharovorans TaxID=28210 RepID=A0A2V3U5M1_9HYPH|nr:CBS domain-containing protein [Chelatococcus asaccharovorans]MBS7704104.1 CBS domain-containing protein [Chelatococcus asaccharovorans]PXW58270.1 CBS domain protein [Chelatococcus asaccharovorans]CAH1666189.1 Inosine-5'-monophosphate dehydrogenase [Chelatococcus asaccharovorans]CAH1681599.1 Inosine-5'-monophosphate dehydrogenase [Chelatococcus asaccharovorans]
MSVDRILAMKGGDVVTIPPHRTLDEAVKLLAEKHIGALVVAGADRKVLGIITERDIVRVLAKEGAVAFSEAVSAHMTANVRTCTGSFLVNDVMELMTLGKFRHVPVVENGVLVGIISIGDVVKHRLAEVEHEHQILREYIATA